MFHLLYVGREFCLVKHFSTHWTLGVTNRVEKMVVIVIFELVTHVANILSDREFTLEFGLLLSVIYCPVIQHALVTPEVYSTLVADTE